MMINKPEVNPGRESESFNVVILGGSYAGIAAALTLLALKDGKPMPLASYGNFAPLKNCPRMHNLRITVLDERDGFFHTIGTPLAHVSSESASHMWKSYAGFSKLRRSDVDIIQGSVSGVDLNSKRFIYSSDDGSRKTIQYDFLLISTGIRRQWPVVPRFCHRAAYLADASIYANRIMASKEKGLVVIEGGVEFSGKIKMHHPKTRLLSNEPLPDEFKSRALELLKEEGVEVILCERPTITALPDQTSRIETNHAKQMNAGHVFWATSQKAPSTGFLPKSLLREDGSIMVDAQVIGHHLSFGHIYATGDVTERHSIRIGGGAMVEGSVAAVNIYSSLMATRDIGFPLVLERCPQVYRLPRMALSIGKNIVCYQGENAPVETGQKLGELCFGQDLGWQKMLNTLGLEDYEEQL
ncbi:hypothetical protein HAV15_011638 [Penicillium sp. str. |nr:hypothetical protein HAV15_011638 [Penicillium sp. str. \